MEFREFFKKRIEPFVAIAILIMLIILTTALLQEHNIKKEIQKNCGWGDEDYRCYCEHSDVIDIEFLLNDSLEIGNVTLVK